MIGLNLNLQKNLDAKRKFPRIFLLSGTEERQTVPGVLLMLPDRTHLPILSMSLSGIVISPVGYLSSLRIGQILNCKLKAMGLDEPIELKLKVARLFSKEAYLMMESISAENRIAMDQNVKDRLIFASLQERDSSSLHPQFQGGYWLNSLFDTNFLFWKSKDNAMIERALIEYDGLCFFFEKESWWLQKSVPSIEEAHGYAGPWVQQNIQKVSMGASWKERLVRLISEAQSQHPELRIFIEILRKI